MGFNDFFKSLFGNKSQRDLKEILPYVNKVKEAYPAIEKLSDDELRARIDDVKNGCRTLSLLRKTVSRS